MLQTSHQKEARGLLTRCSKLLNSMSNIQVPYHIDYFQHPYCNHVQALSQFLYLTLQTCPLLKSKLKQALISLLKKPGLSQSDLSNLKSHFKPKYHGKKFLKKSWINLLVTYNRIQQGTIYKFTINWWKIKNKQIKQNVIQNSAGERHLKMHLFYRTRMKGHYTFDFIDFFKV